MTDFTFDIDRFQRFLQKKFRDAFEKGECTGDTTEILEIEFPEHFKGVLFGDERFQIIALRLTINIPQTSMLTGYTPSDLCKFSLHLHKDHLTEKIIKIPKVSSNINAFRLASEMMQSLFYRGRCLDCGDWDSDIYHTCRGYDAILAMGIETNTICVICQDSCKGVYREECGHSFHKICADKLTNCPLCRLPL